jgi:hypothetical protein
MNPKPGHLGLKYAEQFKDMSIAGSQKSCDFRLPHRRI